MLSLILKDLRVSALFLWLVAPIYAVVALGSALNGQAHFWLTIAAALGLMLLVPGIEWYQGADIFVSTLPVDRALIVRGRFGTSGLVLTISLLAGAYPAVVLGVLGSAAGRGWPVWLNIPTGIEFLLVGVLVIAVSHPVLFRWGPSAAAVAGAVLIAGLAGPTLVAGPAPASLQTIDAPTASQLAPLVRLMIARGGLLLTLAVSALLSAGVILASARLSVTWAKQREF
jgi:hypothetical protein